MRPRWILALALALAAIVALVLFVRRTPEPVAPPAVVEQPPLEAPAETPAPAPEPLEIAEAPASTREASGGESSFVDPGSIEFPGAKIEAEVDDKSPPVKLHGTLSDENTRQPLPDFELEFEVVGEGQGPHRKVATKTDAQGKFECSEPILVARCVVRFLDRQGHRRLPPPWTVDIDDVRKAELKLVVPWGPIYRVAFAPKDAIAATEVELRLRAGPGRGKGGWTSDWEPVHAGEPLWVRFQPLMGVNGKLEKLEARTRDGLWSGEADASTASGFAPGVTLVQFEARAVLAGNVTDGEKHPVADVDVILEAKDAGEKPIKRTARTGADGTFRFERLSACMGTLRVVSVRHAPWSAGVTLLAGQEQKLPIELAPLPIAGAIHVRVESESGLYAPAFQLVLSLENDPVAEAGGERFTRQLRAQWSEEAGRKVANFVFPELPKQVFRVVAQKEDFFVWDPQQLTLQAPAEDARILIRDGVPNASLAFRAKDGLSGEAIEGFELTLEFPGAHWAPRRMGARSGQAFLEHLPLERPLNWRLDAVGHAPALGNQSAFQVLERREDGELRVCELELRAGWGESYRFIDARSRSPLKNIVVLLDGNEAGKSGLSGQVLVRAAAQPASIEYKCDELGIPPRPLRAERRTGCSADVRVGPGQPAKGKH